MKLEGIAVRIGLNVSRPGPEITAALLQVRPGIIVVTDPVDWTAIAACHDAFDCLVIWRPILNGELPHNGEQTPRAIAAYALAVLAAHPGMVQAVQGYNEVISSGNVTYQGPRDLEFVRLMQAQGVPVCALNAGVGNIEHRQIPLLYNLFDEAAIIGAHGYIRPDAWTIDPPYEWNYLRRYATRWAIGNARVNLERFVLTETGTYYNPVKTGIPWHEYARLCIEIHEYALSVGMMGTAAFTLSGYEPWQTTQPWQLVEHPEALAILADYNRIHDGPAPSLGQVLSSSGEGSSQVGQEGTMARTERQQTAIDIVNGWATELARPTLLKKRRLQGAKELATVKGWLEQEFPKVLTLTTSGTAVGGTT